MSHYATINVKALDDVKIPMVREAVKRISKSYTIEKLENLNVPRFGSNNNAVLMVNGVPSQVRFAFKQHEDKRISLTIAGEEYHSPINIKDFADQLSREYSQIKIEQIAKAQHMTPVSRTVKENGDVVLRFALAA